MFGLNGDKGRAPLMADIFLSYARADRACVEKLASVLTEAGFSVWWDRHIESGAQFSAEIEKHLEAAKHVIVCWSAHSAKSVWVKDEATVAARMHKLKAVSLDGAEAPIGYMQYHVVNLKDWLAGKSSTSIDELLASLSQESAQTPDLANLASTKMNGGAFDWVRDRKPAELLGAAAIILMAALMGLTALRGGKETAPPSVTDAKPAAVRTVTAPPPRRALDKSIAVLPFEDLSEARDQEYFSDGVAQEILNALVKLEDLRVAGRASSFSFKGSELDPRSVGDMLGVAHLLAGSVRKQQERVRITAQLVRASDGSYLWSQTYDGTLDNIFDLQDSISRSIASELEIILSPAQQTRIAATLTDNQDAYDYYLRGRELGLRAWGDGVLDEAITNLKRSVALDPNFAEAWAHLARAYFLVPTYQTAADETDYLKEAELAAYRALSINPDLPQALLIIEGLEIINGDLMGALTRMKSLRERFPQNGHIMFVSGMLHASIGHTKKAEDLFTQALAVDPLRGEYLFQYGLTKYKMGDYAEAERAYTAAAKAGYAGAIISGAKMQAHLGDIDGADATIMTAYDAMGEMFNPQFRSRDLWRTYSDAVFHGDTQARARVQGFLAQLLAQPGARTNQPIASIFLDIGADEAFADAYMRNRFSGNMFVLSEIWGPRESDQIFRQSDAFEKFADEVGFVAAWQEHGWPEKCQPSVGALGANDTIAFECD